MLTSWQYAGQKGFCEDLDEGKFSFPLIHCLNAQSIACVPGFNHKLMFQNIFMTRSRSESGCLSREMKLLMLQIMKTTGSLNVTKLALDKIWQELQAELDKAEQTAGIENPDLKNLLRKLKAT